jgi:hypothetical protein
MPLAAMEGMGGGSVGKVVRALLVLGNVTRGWAPGRREMEMAVLNVRTPPTLGDMRDRWCTAKGCAD